MVFARPTKQGRVQINALLQLLSVDLLLSVLICASYLTRGHCERWSDGGAGQPALTFKERVHKRPQEVEKRKPETATLYNVFYFLILSHLDATSPREVGFIIPHLK